jgi:hypothetical protein
MAYTQQDYSIPLDTSVETEEERRKREEEAMLMAPKQPIAPVVPNQTYNRMLQVESNNQNYTPSGQPVTSPKGAMFAAQVMPATAQNPGYGITPAQSQTPEEYNRVGQDYFNAMLKKYNGDQTLATAAYNAGPGRVDKAVQIASTQGGDVLQYLPKETQNYVQKVGVQPQQTQQAPVAPVNPMYTMQGQQPGLQMPEQQPQTSLPPEPTMPPVMNHLRQYEDAQDDPGKLLEISRSDAPDWMKQQAKNRAGEILISNRDKQRAEEEIKSMDPNTLASKLREKTTGGSWTKAIIFGLLGMDQSQQAEAAKLGIGKETSILGADGKPYLVKMSSNGTPIEGYSAETGKKLSANELVTVTSNATGKATDVSLTPHQAVINGEVHTISTKRTPNGIMYKDDTAGTGWTSQAPAGLTHVGAQDPAHLKGLTAANGIVTKMSKANQDAIAVGGQPIYSQQQIEQARNSAYETMTGKPYGGGAMTAPSALSGNQPAPTSNQQPTPNVQPTVNKTPAGNQPKSQAQSILDYDSPPPVGPTTPAKIALLNEVQRLAAQQGKTWDAGQYKIANKTKQDFTTGKQGQTVQSLNVAVDHLDTLSEAAKALENKNIPLFNEIGNMYSKNTGSPQVTDFNALKSIVGSEVAKAVAGGATALGDREEIRREINAASSERQLLSAIEKYQKLMAGQVKGLKQTYESAGLKDFDNKLLPRTQKVLNSVQEPTRSKW